MTASLAVATFLAAVVLLAAVAVGHAEVGRPTTDLLPLDEAAGLLAAAPSAVLRHARGKNPVPTTSTVPTCATAPDTC